MYIGKFLGTMILATLTLLLSPTFSKAGCKSDCADEYTSEKESCALLHDGPDEADDLQMCVDNAKSEYDDCVEECES